MSGNICRETYFNYGSYLRSRGYDKAICDLIDMIESGKIPFGPFRPMGDCNAIITGNLDIVPCPPNIPSAGTGGVNSGMGQLWVQGGYGGTSGAAAITDLGIQSQNGLNNTGPIIQTGSSFQVNVPGVGTLNDQNYLESNTFLDGGLTMNALPSSSGVVFTPPKSVITDIINSNSSTSLPAAWSNGSIPDFPNDYTLATTKAIHDYVAGIAGVTHLSYNGNIGPNTAPQVHLTNEVFKIKGNTVSQSSSSYPQNIITEAQTNQELTIDLTETGVTAGTYGHFTSQQPNSVQTIKPIRIHVDNRGRITSASQLSTAIPVMSSFKVTGDVTNGNPAPAISNSDTLEIVSPSAPNNNIKCVASSTGNGAQVEVSLASTLQNLTEVKTNKLTIPHTNGDSITSILVQGNNANPVISGTGSDDKLATEKAIVSYVSAQSSGMTDWKLQADTNTPPGSVAISNNDLVTIMGDSNNNIKTIRTVTASPASNNIEVELQKQLTKVNSIKSENNQDLTLESNSSTISSVINLNTGSAGEGVKIKHALNIGALTATTTPPATTTSGNLAMKNNAAIGGALNIGAPSQPTTTSGDLKMTGEAAIGGAATIGGALEVDGNVTIGSGPTNTLTINSTTAVPNSNLSNYKVLLIDGNGLVKKSNASADSSTTISSTISSSSLLLLLILLTTTTTTPQRTKSNLRFDET